MTWHKRSRPGGTGTAKGHQGDDDRHQRNAPQRLDPRSAALASAAAHGCRCQPEITVTRLTGRLSSVAVAHDDGFPALTGGGA